MLNYICGLDIGSSKIAACLIKLSKNVPVEVFCEMIPAKGVKAGSIINSMDLSDTVIKLMHKLSQRSGLSPSFVYANISGQDISIKHSKALIPLTEKGAKVISESDIRKVNSQAVLLGSDLEEEIIHSLPFIYSTDGKTGIINPLGLSSHRLESDMLLICARQSLVETFTHTLDQAGLEIKDLFLSGLVSSYAAMDEASRSGNTIFCDIGADISEILLFGDGLLKDVWILPMGGYGINEELQESLKVTFQLAEDIKLSYGEIADNPETIPDKEILIKKDTVYLPMQLKEIRRLVWKRAKHICLALKDKISEKIPLTQVDNFIVMGRTVTQEGFLEMLEKSLGTTVRQARITHPRLSSLLEKNQISGTKTMSYVTAAGIAARALDDYLSPIKNRSITQGNVLQKSFSKLRQIYQDYF